MRSSIVAMSFVAFTLAASAVIATAQSVAPNVASPPGPQMVRRMRMAAPPPAFEGDSATAALTFSRAAPVVEVTIGGKGPFRFLIDTGAGGHGRINAALAHRLALPVAGEVRAGDGSGRVQMRKTFAVDSIELGGVRFRGVQMAELPQLPGLEGQFDGILGLDLFASHLLTLDYANRKLTLSRGHLPPSAASYAPGPGAVMLSLAVGDETLPVQLDTGNSVAPLIVPEALANRLPLAGERRKTAQARTAISTIQMWEADIAVPVRLGSEVLPIRTIGFPSLGDSGNLGSKALAGAILQLDQRNRRIRIDWPAEGARK